MSKPSSTEQIDTDATATPSNTQGPPAQPPQKGKAKIYWSNHSI